MTEATVYKITSNPKETAVPLGWVQDNREKTGPENLRSDAQAMEGEKVKTAHSPWALSSASELQAVASRRREASGEARRGKMSDSLYKIRNSSAQCF